MAAPASLGDIEPAAVRTLDQLGRSFGFRTRFAADKSQALVPVRPPGHAARLGAKLIGIE